MDSQIRMHDSWRKRLEKEFSLPYMNNLKLFLRGERQSNINGVFPQSIEVFKAFEVTPFKELKVVLLGQDPYHNVGQAHGLCFSVKPPTPPPPSLVNVFKEIKRDLNIDNINGGLGDLTAWAEQGVFLLNSVLTVRAHEAGSHRKRGWEEFTDQVIKLISQELDGVVFLLWGGYAKQKVSLIDSSKHFVLTAPHPSPLSAHLGFLGCGHFSKVNDYLKKQNKSPINWQI